MLRRKLLVLATIGVLSLTLLSVNADEVNLDSNVNVTSDIQEYKIVNGYNYNIESVLAGSPDSFEAWVKLPVSSIGGAIAGNYHETSYSYDTVNWEVNALGYFGFQWNDKAITYTFDKTTCLFDNQWHHVVLVRTDEAFTYYLDGEVEGVYEIESSGCVSTATMNIGVDKGTWRVNKNPFEGYIKQVTIYSGAINQEQIKADMSNEAITSNDKLSEDTKLLGNWYLGEVWTNRVVKSSEEGTPSANIYTYEKYVGADYSFGEYDYTFVIMPDIQIMTNYNPARLNRLTKWIVDKKQELNIQFAIQVGDLSDFGQKEEQYITAANALDKFNNVIPYCFVPGNHDYNDNAATRDTTYLNRHFSVEKHSQLPGFGGVFEEGKIENNYYLFEACGIDYLVLNLEYHPRLSVMRWASRVIEQYPQHRVIINTHDNVNPDGTFVQSVSAGYEANGSQKLFDALVSKYDNVFLNIGGHHCYDDIVKRTDYGKNGNKILSMLVDGQGTKYQGENAQDMVLLVHVNETNKTMNFIYYSPDKGKVWNIQNQFQYSFADELNPTIGK